MSEEMKPEAKIEELKRRLGRYKVLYADLDNSHQCLITDAEQLKEKLSVALEALHKIVDIDMGHGVVHESCAIAIQAIKKIEGL